ncbi:ribonuclease HI [Novosphingobium soli]|uniref:Ribonuclease HI n=1 Tax=Novosphingobium soli TaxID=574956 RepID=A0ABV6D0U7_9SPHN
MAGRRRVKVFFDGGCRPNPGPIEAAVVIRGTIHLFDDLGHGDNADAEWLALIRALELAQAQALPSFELIGDALDVIRRANRALQDGAHTSGHAARFVALATVTPPLRVRWLRREQNLAGIALAARHPRG